jgi:hypothetical protein
MLFVILVILVISQFELFVIPIGVFELFLFNLSLIDRHPFSIYVMSSYTPFPGVTFSSYSGTGPITFKYALVASVGLSVLFCHAH